MKTRSLLASLAALAALLALAVPAAEAQVSITPFITPTTLQQGQSYQFTYNVANSSSSSVYFSGDVPGFSLTPAGAATEAPMSTPGTLIDQTYVGLDDNAFLNDLSNPASLAGSSSSLYHVFDILVGSSATLGIYSGTVELTGGATPGAADSFSPPAFATFSFTVVTPSTNPPVPEASTTVSFGLLLALGLGGGVIAAKRRKSSAAV